MNRRNDVQAGLVTRLIPDLVLVMGGSAGGRMSLGVGESFPAARGQQGMGSTLCLQCSCLATLQSPLQAGALGEGDEIRPRTCIGPNQTCKKSIDSMRWIQQDLNADLQYWKGACQWEGDRLFTQSDRNRTNGWL